MNAKKSKKVLLLASLSTLAVSAAVMAISFNSEVVKVRGLGEVVNGTITWTTANSEKSGSSNKISWKRQTASGTDMYLYSFGKWNPSGQKLFDAAKDTANDYALYVKSEAGAGGAMFEFQYITSVSIVSFDSQSGSEYAIYTDSSASGVPAVTQSLGSSEETHSFTTEVEGAKYLTIKPTNNKWFAIKEITITYSCEPGGRSSYNVTPMQDVGYTINPSKTSASAGETVSFSVNVETGYTLNGVSVKNGSEDVEVTGPVAGAYSFVMPAGDVKINTDMDGLHHIALAGGTKTKYIVGDSFEKPIVYAYYYDSSMVTVSSDAVVTGYDTSVVGEQTVTVSYTDANSATVETQYTITVSATAGYSVSYAGYDYVDDQPLELSTVLDLDSCVLPNICEGGETLQFTLVFKEFFFDKFNDYAPSFVEYPYFYDFNLVDYDYLELTFVWEVEMQDSDVTILIGCMYWDD